MQLSELGPCGGNKNAEAPKQLQKGFEPRLPRFRVRCSTSELSCSTDVCSNGLVANSLLCTSCMKWVDRRCSAVTG